MAPRNYLTSFPQLLAEWDAEANGKAHKKDSRHPNDPALVAARSNRKVHWLCSQCGHGWMATVANRTTGRGCPICSRKKQAIRAHQRALEKNPLSSHGQIVPLWDRKRNKIPLEDVAAGSATKCWFLCPHGKSFLVDPRSMVRLGKVRCSCEEELLVDASPAIGRYYADERDISSLSKTYSRKLQWKCPICQEHFKLSPSTFLQRLAREEDPCPSYSFRLLVPGKNDLATTQPVLVTELVNPVLASTLTENSSFKVEWRCRENENHIYTTTPKQRLRGVSCKICTAQKRGQARHEDSSRITPYALAHVEEPWKVVASTLSERNSKVILPFNYQCGHRRETSLQNFMNSSECPICHSGQHASKGQTELLNFVKSILPGMRVEENQKVLGSKEVDIWLPEKNFAIEYNGLYWHSEQWRKKNAHEEKYQLAKERGITLIQIWEDSWKKSRTAVERMLALRLGVPAKEALGARKYLVEEIPFSTMSSFLKANHVRGEAKGTFYLGLSQGNDLVASMVLIKKEEDLVIERYAATQRIPGAFTKFLSHAEKLYQPKAFVALSDNCLAEGKFYEDHGFQLIEKLSPAYSYCHGGERKPNSLFSKTFFENDPKLLYDPKLNEGELAKLNQLWPIYDAGRDKWFKKS